MPAAEPTLHHTDVRGLRLAWWERHAEARGRGPTLLFVHATGFHGRVWDAVIERFPGHHSIAVDQRGHGHSAAAPFASWEAFGRDLAGLAEALALDGALGIGHSMGAHALVQAAAFAPACFARLLLIDPVVFAPAEYHHPPPAGQGHPVARRRAHFASPAALAERLGDRVPYAGFDRRVLHDYCAHALRPADDGDGQVLACAPEFEAAVYAAARGNPGVYASIRALARPVRVLRARRPDPQATAFDPLASPTWPGLAAEFHNGRDDFRPAAAHLLPMDDPAAVAAVVAEELAAMGG